MAEPWEQHGISRATWFRWRKSGKLAALERPAGTGTLAEWIGRLRIVQGSRAGEPFEVLPWQRDLLAAIENPGYSRIAFSAARGNGKSALMGALAAWHLAHCGPNEDCIIVAGSFGQARASIGRFLRAWVPPGLRVRDSAQRFEAIHPNGSRAAIIGCDPKRAHGLGPKFALLDEPSEWERTKRDDMREALDTALGKIAGSRLIAFATRPHERHHWFARMLASESPDTYRQLHAAGREDDPFDADTWRAANPSWDALPDLREAIRREAEAAKLDPELLPQFQRRRLNLPVTPDARTIVAAAEWELLEHGQAERIGPCYLGADLGGSASLTAAVAYWPESGRLEVWQGIGSHPSLAVRSQRDGTPYGDWDALGLLWAWDSRTTPVAAFLGRVAGELSGCEVAGVEADDYRWGELCDAVDALGLDWPPVQVRRPSKSKAGGAYDVRQFRRAVLEGRIDCGRGRVMLEHAIGNSAIRHDPAGNEVLDKSRHNGRIDCLSAAVIAVGMAAAQPVADWDSYTVTVC